MTLPENFWDKTTTSDCTIWTGAVNSKGYGCFAIERVSHLAHRIAYEDVHGPIADGMTVDHTCRVRNCVNVDHLELVSGAENTRRRFKAHGGLDVGGMCLNGHSIRAEQDVYVNRQGRRECQECRRGQQVRAKERLSNTVEPGSNPAIREWALANGFEVGVRGRIPAEIKDAYAVSRAAA